MMGLFLRWLAPRYAVWIARRHLDGVWIRGVDRLRAELAKGPVIVAANHLGWWDGQILLILFFLLDIDGRFLIKEDNFREMAYMRHLGGIPIDRGSVSGALAGLEASAAWLVPADRPRLLWIFPQGRYRPSSMRPLGLERGVALLQRMTGAPIIPVGFVSGWRLLHLPAWVITVGEPIPAPARGARRTEVMERLEAAIEAEIEAGERWLDQPEAEPPMELLVPSTVVPFQDRFGARIYVFFARLVGWVRGLFGLA